MGDGIQASGTLDRVLRGSGFGSTRLRLVQAPAKAVMRAATGLAPATVQRLAAVALGVLSLVLYALLFWLDEELIELAQSARRGEKRFFFVPIALALLFSFVHGAFTGRFWDVLGLKARV